MTQDNNDLYQAEYQEPITGFGITARQLWFIIGVNTLISATISLLVVLVVGPWAFSGAVSGLLAETPMVTSQLLAQQPSLGDATPIPNTPTPTFTPPPEPVLYAVQAGDTLSLIAEQFGISQDDIMTANGLTDPDTLQAGQSLLIPVGGLSNATPTFTPEAIPTDTALPFDPPTPEGGTSNPPLDDVSVTPTQSPTPIPTATAQPDNEIRVVIDTILGYGQVDEEMITILNEGPGVNLYGWKLVGDAEPNYEFPNLFLWNGGSIRIHTRIGTNTHSDLYWAQTEAQWLSGETVNLVNSSNEVIATYLIP